MKTQQLFMLTLSAMVIMGCSKDALDEPVIELTDLEMNRSGINETRVESQNFIITGQGTYVMVKPEFCEDLNQLMMEGTSRHGLLGEFNTFMRKCTDFREQNIIRGRHVMKNGDELLFYSNISGTDRHGNWSLYIYEGGTGKFMNATGEVRMYHIENHGSYKNYGEGRLSL